MKLILLGAPGSGKGTLAEGLIKRYNIPEISSGEILRRFSKDNTELGTRVRALLKDGKFVPNNVIIGLMRRRMDMPDCKHGYILDGFPRNVSQAEALEKLTKVEKVIKLNVSPKTVILRLSGRRTCKKCGAVYHIKYRPPKKDNMCDQCNTELYHRSDDRAEAIKNRLKIYIEQTKPLIGYYSKQGRLVEVDAEQTPEEVLQDVIDILEVKKANV